MPLRLEEQREFFRDARRARYLARLVGKAADLIAAMSLWHIPGAAGVFAALFYILMCDGFPGGRSLGKWLTGLKVVLLDLASGGGPALLEIGTSAETSRATYRKILGN